MPAHADTLSGREAQRVDAADDLMARYARILDAWECAVFDEGVAVADAAGFDLDAHLARSGFRKRAFDHLVLGSGGAPSAAQVNSPSSEYSATGAKIAFAR
ncbi:MAG: hypothetical protein P8011_08550 [Acidihalobacter sp.]|uniref:hypothetical protein n=1 Tax=Acidihalobacter sp. TaxID=1872108 RepID=UPI00307F94E7